MLTRRLPQTAAAALVVTFATLPCAVALAGGYDDALTDRVLEQAIRITHAALIRDFGIAAPRIAVAGLNPHAGEGGTIGHEEIRRFRPLLDRLRAEGMQIAGPLPAVARALIGRLGGQA